MGTSILLTFISCIQDGHIENFTNITSCDFAPGKPVFRSTQVDFDDKFLPEKLDRTLFGPGCTFCLNLSISFDAKERANESGHEVIRDNIYRIVKLGFRANRFAWKSKSVYKNVTVLGKFSLDEYLVLLTGQGVLKRQPSHTGSEIGYVVSEAVVRRCAKTRGGKGFDPSYDRPHRQLVQRSQLSFAD